MDKFSKYPNPGIEFHDKEMEDVMFIFLYHIFNLHFPEGTIQYCNELLLLRFDVL